MKKELKKMIKVSENFNEDFAKKDLCISAIEQLILENQIVIMKSLLEISEKDDICDLS